MDEITSDIKREAERGVMVKALVDYDLEWMPFAALRAQAAGRLGYPLSDAEMKFHLNYLEQGGYLETKLLRSGRAQLEMTVIRGTAKAVDMVETRSAPDPGVGI